MSTWRQIAELWITWCIKISIVVFGMSFLNLTSSQFWGVLIIIGVILL